MPILKTRLHKPSVGKPFILRQRLLDLLDTGMSKPLTLVIGGAGYGKSVLVSQWLDVSHQKYCWISLEEDCNDLQVFLTYLVSGIQQAYAGSMPRMAQLIESNVLPPNKVVAQTLNNELSDLEGNLTIVLDDLHKINNQQLFDLLNQLIKFVPEKVRLVLISRRDLPLNKARLEAYNQMCEIRMADLRLNLSELMEMAEIVIPNGISQEMAELIEDKTEGWFLGVNLLLKDYAVKGSEPIFKLPDKPGKRKTDVLFELIEQDIETDLLKILLAASLFERFNIDLLEELFDATENLGSNNERLIKQFRLLQRHGTTTYLIPLDAVGRWYRMHHLIEEILKKRLVGQSSPEEIETYYSIAGAYFAGIDCYEEGIRYSLLGKNEGLAVQILESNWEHLIDAGQNLRLHRWIKMIPADLSNTNPTLLVMRAFLCDNFADYDAMKAYLGNASSLIDEKTADPRLIGAFASVHSCFSTYTNDFQTALHFADKALETLLPDQEFLLDYALNFKVFATSMIKSPDQTREVINTYRARPEFRKHRRLLHINVIQLLFDWNQATPADMRTSGKTVVDISRQVKVWWLYKIGNYYLGQYHYLKNQIPETYPYIDAGIDCFFNSGPVWTLQLYYSGVLAALAENNIQKAQGYMKAARSFVDLNLLSEFEGYLRAFEVEFALRTGDLNKAWNLNSGANYNLHPPLYYYYIPQCTQIKLLISKGDEALMKEALDLIHRYKELCTKLPYACIQITLLEAFWHVRAGQDEKAVNTLSKAIAITPDDTYIRVFLDIDDRVKRLFEDLPEAQKETPLTRNILKALSYGKGLRSTPMKTDPLTSKEATLMELVARGLRNKEIADKMCLSEATIKTYLYKIYQKLGVKSRTAALLKFKKLETL